MSETGRRRRRRQRQHDNKKTFSTHEHFRLHEKWIVVRRTLIRKMVSKSMPDAVRPFECYRCDAQTNLGRH